MTDREIEQKLAHAVEAATPDVLESVLARCEAEKGQVIQMPKKKNIFIKAAAIAAALALVLGLSLFALPYLGSSPVASVVTLDVNPSIEMKLDKDARVLEANALNKDAAKVLAGMELKNTNLTTATNAIIGSLLKHGYLDELRNSILISVEDEDAQRGARLQDSLSKEVNEFLSSASIQAAVLSQVIEGEVPESREHHISQGKAALIEKILEVNPSYRFEELAELSVQELSLLMENPKNQGTAVNSVGAANDSAYIGREKAKAIALEHAGAAEPDVRDLEVDFDFEKGVMVYEVDFDWNRQEYEYDINALTGEIVHSKVEQDEDATQQPVTPEPPPAESTPTDIGADQAKAIALQHAGVTEAEVSRLYVEREYDDGRPEYQVEFHMGTSEYEYEIDAATGKIVDYDLDREENDGPDDICDDDWDDDDRDDDWDDDDDDDDWDD